MKVPAPVDIPTLIADIAVVLGKGWVSVKEPYHSENNRTLQHPDGRSINVSYAEYGGNAGRLRLEARYPEAYKTTIAGDLRRPIPPSITRDPKRPSVVLANSIRRDLIEPYTALIEQAKALHAERDHAYRERNDVIRAVTSADPTYSGPFSADSVCTLAGGIKQEVSVANGTDYRVSVKFDALPPELARLLVRAVHTYATAQEKAS